MTTAEIFSNKKFVITGGFRKGNQETIQNRIRLLGGKVMQNVSSRTDYLIVADDNPNGRKFKKALELNSNACEYVVKLMTEDQFYKYADM